MNEVIKKFKPVPKFNVGHFPPGTRVIFESNFLDRVTDKTKVYEGQDFGVVTDAEVVQVICNGPNSYLLEFDIPSLSPVSPGNHTSNMDWVREILVRGKDSCAPKPARVGGHVVNDIILRNDSHGDHHYDIDAIMTIVYRQGDLKTLSKKKLRRLVKRIMPHNRTTVKELERRDREFWDEMYDDIPEDAIY